MADPLDAPMMQRITANLAVTAIAWMSLVTMAEGSGFLRALHPPLIGVCT